MDSDIISSSIESQMDWMQILTQLEDNYQNETPSHFDQFHKTPPIPTAHPLTPSFPIHNIKSGTSMQEMREMIFCMAAMQPIHIDPESVKPPKRRNVKISKDPQSVAARMRRERISEKIRILQRLVPGGTKMDTASMLDEAVQYMKFLKNQVRSMEKATAGRYNRNTISFNNGILKPPHQLLS